MRTCLLVGAAPSDHRGLKRVLQACSFEAIFAVDGGFATLATRGIKPDGVFGDFDSLGFVPGNGEGDNAASELIREEERAQSGESDDMRALEQGMLKNLQVEVFETHKDFTDMAWAIEHAADLGYTNIVMCDGLDGRLDHSLANLQLMASAARRGQRVWGVTENEVVITLDAQGGLGELSVESGAKGTCSVLAHSNEVFSVTETGMEYSLDNATLNSVNPLGISNELIGEEVFISIGQGSAWVFLPLSELERIVYAGETLV